MSVGSERVDHERSVIRVTERVLRPDALTPAAARRAAFDGSAAEPSVAEVTERIRRDAREVTDDQVQDLIRFFGSQAAAFEIIMAATIGAGMERWHAAVRAVEDASDAAP